MPLSKEASITDPSAPLSVEALHALAHKLPHKSVLPLPKSFDDLALRLTYLSPSELQQVRAAYRFADAAHLGQFRASGEPYITHPIAVAGLCADQKLDHQALMAALMHDAMEDCGITKSELIEQFGSPVAELVDGLTKLDKLHFSTKEESQAESFRKMLLAMARDVRVILIKLNDRLHNMQTMDAMPQNKRSRIARETLDIYAPIAHRLGLNQMYRQLQELSFTYLKPWRAPALLKAVSKARGNRRDLVDKVRLDVVRAFDVAKITVDVMGREKTAYSIYQKMKEKRISFAAVNDIFGFRIVVKSIPDCYLALGVLHQMYKPMPGRFKDYIAIPKANGYQSLHTTLVSPLGTPVEFQIRTELMHAVAEQGVAAHWVYKVGTQASMEPQALGHKWLSSLLDIQGETRDAAEFLEHVKIDLFPDAIYVFTPKSRILALPRGATPVDFAYTIHSDIGDHCVAAKVNGESVALRTELHSGDVVEIITSSSAKPNPGWLNFVRTGRARSRIRHYLKTLEEEESFELGQRLLNQALRAEGLQLPPGEETDASANGSLWQQLVRWSSSKSKKDLFTEIGHGRKIAVIVAKQLAKLIRETMGTRPDAVTLSQARFGTSDDTPSHAAIVIDGEDGATLQLASCCRPIPGDEIHGYLGRGEGLIVHTHECSVGRRLKERDREHWINVEWAEEPVRVFETAVLVQVRNHKGVFAQVAQAVSTAEADIAHIAMNDSRQGDVIELRLLIAVRDRLHLSEVLRALRRIEPIIKVTRAKG